MATSLNFKDIIDLPEWRPLANAPAVSSSGACLVSDPRGTEGRHPLVYYLTSNTTFYAYNVKNDEWFQLASPALAGTFGAGAGMVFSPTQGPMGTLAAGWSTTQGALTTALPATVGPNQLANRGDGTRGFKIRIIGSSAGGSGKTEERLIIANSGPSTTPTIVLDSPLSFTPQSGDTYEILSGRVFMLGAGTTAAGIWKYYDVATNSFSGNLTTTNLPATIGTDTCFAALSEAYNPYDKNNGEGFVTNSGTTYNGGVHKCLQATAIAAGTITGHSGAGIGDAAVLANEYRNFQIRIVEDTVPTAVGQRRRITSHTAGPSAVYTLASNWTVNPSSTAKFVIENDDDKILMWTSAAATTYNYNVTANTWDTTTWAARGTAIGAGAKAEQAYGIIPDTNKYARHSYIYSPRGGNSTAWDLFDIAGAATGVWSSAITVGGSSNINFSTGTSATYDPNTLGGKYMYLNQNGVQRFLRFDMATRVLEPYGFMRYLQSTAVVGEKMVYTTFIDGNTKLGFIMTLRNSGSEWFQLALQR